MKDGEIKAMGEYEEVLKHEIVKEIVSIHKKNQEEKKDAFAKGEDVEVDSESSETLELGLMRKKSSTLAKLTPESVK
jgi:hypothetical protein